MSRSSQISELFSTMDTIYVPAGDTENMSQSNWSRVEEECANEEDRNTAKIEHHHYNTGTLLYIYR